jgi:MHS family proline/betaine transporter-like MFS transporter
LGALVFGYEGDKRGRRPALVISIGLMTFSSFCIALIPSFETIGWAAFILFSFFRCLQSFAAGGEFTGGMLYLVESAPLKKRGFYGSFSFFGLSLGIVVSSFNYLIFGGDLSEMQFLKWGWRMLYFFGAIAGMMVFLLRRRFHETHLFLEAKYATQGENNPLVEMVKNHKGALMKTFGIGIVEAVGFNLLIGFLVHYWHTTFQVPLKSALEMNCFALFFFPFLIIFFGKLTSIWHIKKQAIVTAMLLCCVSIPLFFLMAGQGDWGKVVGLILFLVILSGYMVALPALYCEMFPTRVRFIGVSLGYNLAVSLFGASAPDAVMYLTRFMPPALDIGVYLTLAALISLVALLLTKEKIISVR